MHLKSFSIFIILFLSVNLSAGILNSQKKLGACAASDGTVAFALFAPGKTSVSVVGDFNSWNKTANPCSIDGDGIWSCSIKMDSGEYRYKYLVDGTLYIGDPYAREVDWNSTGANSVLKVGGFGYSWGDSFYDAPAMNDLIIYETHIGDFSQSGTYRGMAAKLPYLKSLGINAIELMPIMEFPGDISWGYNPCFFFAPETAYGNPEDLKSLIDQSHQNGIAVILDVVFNHVHHESPLNQLYNYNKNPYMSTDGNPWGFPDLNHWADCTKRFTKDVVEFWMKEYHIDGFRYDYTIGIGYDGYNGVSYFSWAARQFKNNVYQIAEHLPQDPHLVQTTNINSEWHDTFHDQMKANLREGTYSGSNYWGDLDKTQKALNFAADGFSDNAQCINYTESHDEERVIYEALTNSSIDYNLAVQKSRLAAIAIFTAAGIPMLYQGQEWGEDTRKTIDPNKIHWDKLNSDTGKSLCWMYAVMIKLRKDHPALRYNNYELMRNYSDKKVTIFKRWDTNGDIVVVVLNFSNDTQYVDIPFPNNGKWYERIYNFAADVSGNTLSNHDIPASSGKVFCLKKTW
ncbi:MAG: alpha-amylase family glycosyl hydrolase [Candidatus Wallbacteria bacterium]|nr:alpha-amylase family glycosyl hydrolase [Candidatus Wallbacteria bacterium]